ncbi:MAG TPA: TrmH family RNA methyltransferase [Deltaproteobacteria bacterium]|nr:TrmH family RNA methyltransferase [Deltaproteobacteria bacterium]
MSQVIRHRVMQCTAERCSLRFPVVEHDNRGLRCPRCGSPTVVGVGLYDEHKAPRCVADPDLPRIEVLLDNIRSVYNVGSIFRTADAAGISRLHLCGITPTPQHPRLKKTALGADESIPWDYSSSGLAAAAGLKARGLRLWALEGGDRSESIFSCNPTLSLGPVALVIGNEVCGVDPAIISLCERVIGIPMQGVKTSLNTAVAFGIAVFTMVHGTGP